MLIWLNVHLLQIRNQFCWLNFLICFSMSFNWNFTCYFTWFHVIYNQFGTHYSIIFNCTLPNSNAFSRLTCSDYLKLLPAGATPVAPAATKALPPGRAFSRQKRCSRLSTYKRNASNKECFEGKSEHSLLFSWQDTLPLKVRSPNAFVFRSTTTDNYSRAIGVPSSWISNQVYSNTKAHSGVFRQNGSYKFDYGLPFLDPYPCAFLVVVDNRDFQLRFHSIPTLATNSSPTTCQGILRFVSESDCWRRCPYCRCLCSNFFRRWAAGSHHRQ